MRAPLRTRKRILATLLLLLFGRELGLLHTSSLTHAPFVSPLCLNRATGSAQGAAKGGFRRQEGEGPCWRAEMNGFLPRSECASGPPQLLWANHRWEIIWEVVRTCGCARR